MTLSSVRTFVSNRPVLTLEAVLALAVVGAVAFELVTLFDTPSWLDGVSLLSAVLVTSALLTLVVLGHSLVSAVRVLRSNDRPTSTRRRTVSVALRGLQAVIAAILALFVGGGLTFVSSLSPDPRVGLGGFAFVWVLLFVLGALSLALVTLAHVGGELVTRRASS